MEKLIKIILKLDPRKMRHIDVISNKDSESTLSKLYQAVVDGIIKTDEDAAFLLYGDKKAKTATKFINRKKEFEDAVLNTLLFIDWTNDQWDEVMKLKFEANYRWMIIKNLSLNSLSDYANEKAKALLKETKKYEYTEITVECLGIIKSQYALKGEIDMFEKTQAEFEDFEELLHAERKVRSYKERLKAYYVNSAAPRPEHSELAKKYIAELAPYLSKYDAYSLHLNAFLVESYIYSTVSDYAGWLNLSERALTYIQSKPFNFESSLSYYLGQKGVAAIYLKEFDIAEEAIDKAIALSPTKTFNWFKQVEYKMFLLFRMARYKEAYTLYTETTTLNEFKSLDGINKEIWVIFDAYFHLLQGCGFKIFHVGNLKPLFSYSKFDNDTEKIEQDKSGFNLAKKILELCFALIQKENIEEKKEGLSKYLLRYTTDNKPNRKFFVFAKLLLEIPDIEFNKEKTTKKINKLFAEFKTIENLPDSEIYRIEPIELDLVWELLLKELKLEL